MLCHDIAFTEAHMKHRELIPIAGLAATIAIAVGCVVQLAGEAADRRLIAGGPFESSGVAYVPGSRGVLFVDDGRGRQIFWMELSTEGAQQGSAVPVAIGADVTDLEGITSNGTHFYVVGSQSKAAGVDGDGLVRFRFNAATRQVDGLERIQGLKQWLAANVAELRGADRQKGKQAMNIEGLAWDPVNQRLLMGLRTPIIDGQALVIPVSLIDPAAPLTTANLRVDGGKAIRLALDGAGIRSLEYDEPSKAFHVITGAGANSGNGDFRIVEWKGEGQPGVRELARFPGELKPEGITRATLDGRSVRLVVFDTGHYAMLD
jgi:hypothetical protein